MSLNILFIKEETVKKRTGISDYIAGEQITPAIKLAQDMHILPALGSGLYNRLQEGLRDNNLTTTERNLINFYITDPLAWYTISHLTTMISYQFFAKGVLQKTAEESNAPSKGELELIKREYQSTGEFYRQRLIDYLRENYILFDKYLNPGTGIDVIFPQVKGYTSPIYLGQRRHKDKSYLYQITSKGDNTLYYTTQGGETQFTVQELIGRTVKSVSRSGLAKIITADATTDTNYLQIVNGTVFAPTGDIFQNEPFIFVYA